MTEGGAPSVAGRVATRSELTICFCETGPANLDSVVAQL